MALFINNYGSAQTKETLVAGVPGKIILVTRICLCVGGDATAKLLSDPNGAEETDLTPPLKVKEHHTLDLVLGKRFGVATGRGKALALTTTVGLPSTAHGIMVWYELVD